MSKETYETSDFALATALSLSFKILELKDVINSRRKNFIFEKTKKLQDEISKFWKGELRVEPKAFTNQQHALKTMLYNKGD